MYGPGRINVFRLVRESARCSVSARGAYKAKRSRLDNSQSTYPSSRSWRPVSVICCSVLVIFSLPGCLANSFGVRDAAQPPPVAPYLADEILLEVNDVSLKWGEGKVGQTVQTALIKNHIFKDVHYPTYPTREIPFKLRIVARGDIESESVSGFLKAFITGLLLFLPSGVIQYQDTFRVEVEGHLIAKSVFASSLTARSEVDAHHILFATPMSYSVRASELALEDLGNGISAALRGHPEWFTMQ